MDDLKNDKYFEDIICARATPPGASAIAVIRVSGKSSFAVLNKIFKSKKGNSDFKTHRVYYGDIVDGGETVDECIVLTFSEGKSFTGEESFEINSHGSEIVVNLIINLLCRNGVRLAMPGEFSKRAFLNGKIDLSGAEAIMDIVHSSTEQSAKSALKQLNGQVKNEIDTIKFSLRDLLAAIEVYIDYPEEDLSIDCGRWVSELMDIYDKTNALLAGFKRGQYLREGVTAVILGRTNAGKSTLFNYLLNEDKAIVSDIHGTTRDYIDGVINIGGYGVRIYDTAGLRETSDPIELEGTRRSVAVSQKSDIVIYVIDAFSGLNGDDISNIKNITGSQKLLFVINKVDIPQADINILHKTCTEILDKKGLTYGIVKISALNRSGVDDFNREFIRLLTDDPQSEGADPVITNIRHANLIENTISNYDQAVERLKEENLDLAAFEIREAMDNLGEITGEVTTDDILAKIFSSFCIGK